MPSDWQEASFINEKFNMGFFILLGWLSDLKFDLFEGKILQSVSESTNPLRSFLDKREDKSLLKESINYCMTKSKEKEQTMKEKKLQYRLQQKFKWKEKKESQYSKKFDVEEYYLNIYLITCITFASLI